MMQPQPEAEGLEASGKSLVQVIIQRLNSNGSSKKKKKICSRILSRRVWCMSKPPPNFFHPGPYPIGNSYPHLGLVFPMQFANTHASHLRKHLHTHAHTHTHTHTPMHTLSIFQTSVNPAKSTTKNNHHVGLQLLNMK
jgi:hypothetical protein